MTQNFAVALFGRSVYIIGRQSKSPRAEDSSKAQLNYLEV
jgi:hypothetical protein